ncbi:tripartite tricarboxylate transporter substrate binding protein [Bordetella sp. BOR01]|uniref:Bug family tripartite tricarboxylate transporter substrate binding protein n=1 Tax=Bordetella sp. BOR01 TaxID=2854779 RepID=UPI001C45B0C2|nr:tripartite tricarboxylate transporter substrate binding protein [Bordetella sp. BOR01]MBV7486966.1 tripartite tricarboxylate transporter substrate binding protein [Bordetella sp. BOR01]
MRFPSLRRLPCGLSGLLLTLATLLPTASTAIAATWPSKPIHMLVGFPAGGASDVMARLVADKLSQGLGQPVIVENRPGAAGTLAASTAARAEPDGYTLLLASPTAITLAPSTMAGTISYAPAKDLAAISKVADYPLFLLARPDLGPRDIGQLLALAHKQPGQLNFGSFGNNTSGALATEMLKLMGQADMLHVPFNGSAPALQALLGGNVDLLFDTAVTAVPNMRAGKLVALAVSGAERSKIAPDLPTVAETLPGFEAGSWVGLMAPAGTPAPVIDRIQGEVARLVALPDMRARFAQMGAEPVGDTPAEFQRTLQAETQRYAQLVKAANLKAQ